MLASLCCDDLIWPCGLTMEEYEEKDAIFVCCMQSDLVIWFGSILLQCAVSGLNVNFMKFLSMQHLPYNAACALSITNVFVSSLLCPIIHFLFQCVIACASIRACICHLVWPDMNFFSSPLCWWNSIIISMLMHFTKIVDGSNYFLNYWYIDWWQMVMHVCLIYKVLDCKLIVYSLL